MKQSQLYILIGNLWCMTSLLASTDFKQILAAVGMGAYFLIAFKLLSMEIKG